MQNKIAAVFGGSGFLGRYVVRALAAEKWRIRAACRRPYLAGHLQPMGDVGQIHAVQANVRYAYSVAGAIDGAETVINLAGISQSYRSQTFKSVNIDGARAVASASRIAGVKTLVHVSMICADSSSKSRLARSRAEGEAAVFDEFPEAIVLRPTSVFGAEDQIFNSIGRIARISPLMPVISSVRKMQLVYVGDVAAAVAAACAGLAIPGTIYELGGPDVMSCRELVNRVLIWTGRRRSLVPVPFWSAKIAVAASVLMPSKLRPLTLDELTTMGQPNLVCDLAIRERRTLGSLGVVDPRSVAGIVPSYLEQYHPRGQFARYRHRLPPSVTD